MRLQYFMIGFLSCGIIYRLDRNLTDDIIYPIALLIIQVILLVAKECYEKENIGA